MNVKKLISRQLIRFERGRWYASTLQFLLILALSIKSFGIDEKLGVPLLIVELIAMVGGVISLFIIGYLDDKYGFFKGSKDYNWASTPIFAEMSVRIKNIEEKLNKKS